MDQRRISNRLLGSDRFRFAFQKDYSGSSPRKDGVSGGMVGLFSSKEWSQETLPSGERGLG